MLSDSRRDKQRAIREKIEDYVLINFSVANFRSFGEEQILDLVPNGKLQDHLDHPLALPNDKGNLLPAAVLYGANASGKSNLVKAIYLAQQLITTGDNLYQIVGERCRLGSDDARMPTFEFQFFSRGRIYRYRFSVNSKDVHEESLFAENDSGREQAVFERRGETITFPSLQPFGDGGKLASKVLDSLQTLGVRSDELLLRTIVGFDEKRHGELLAAPGWWFENCLQVIGPNVPRRGIEVLLDRVDEFREFAQRFLNTAGTGIGSLEVERRIHPAAELPDELVRLIQRSPDENIVGVEISPGLNFQFDNADQSNIIRRSLTAIHRTSNGEFSLPFRDESDGTKSLLHLLPFLYMTALFPKVYVIDELDRSLHPLLTRAYVKFFLEMPRAYNSQLIVTTHDSNLLDAELLRRDEVWFVEKDKSQQSRLYSLDDLNVRNDVRLEKGYLNGRFGAIPVFGDLQKLKDLLEARSVETEDAIAAP